MSKPLPYETDLPYAPTDREQLSEIMGGFACDPTVECRQVQPFHDRDHLIQGGDLTEAEQLLKSHPDFIVSAICRCKHERKNATWNRSEPLSDEFVIGFLVASPLNLNANKRKKLDGLRRRK